METSTVPLVYVKDGRPVRAGPGGRWVAAARDDGVGWVAKLFEASKAVYVYDLDGQTAGAANLPFLQSLEKRQVFPWVDAAPRSPEDAMDILFAGAEALTIQPKRMGDEHLADLVGLADADLHVAFSTGVHGIDGGVRPRDAVELAQRLGAKGIVLYETPTSDLQRALDAAFEVTRAGLAAAWMGRPGSPHVDKAAAAQRFTTVLRPEAGA